ncbi:MAG: DNA-directed RNA polymerase subunit alpha, partial [Proteobacteria bacterium]|nr:DNA-directed RNA polymerase subunit alpha [Pseudomonadota bacterium]
MDPNLQELLDKPLSLWSLSVRASNCLEAAKVDTLRQLVIL